MLLTDEEWSIVALSAQVALSSLASMVVPGIALGWLLARKRFPGKIVVDMAVHLPLVLPPVVTGYLLLVLLGHGSAFGRWLESHGLGVAFTWRGAALAAAVMSFPLMVRSVRTAIELVDPRLEDAVRTLGASPLRVILTVTLPLAAPGVIAGMVLSFARGLGEFGATMTLAGNIPGQSRTLPVAIFSYSQTPHGDDEVLRLLLISLTVSVLALLASELLTRRMQSRRVA